MLAKFFTNNALYVGKNNLYWSLLTRRRNFFYNSNDKIHLGNSNSIICTWKILLRNVLLYHSKLSSYSAYIIRFNSNKIIFTQSEIIAQDILYQALFLFYIAWEISFTATVIFEWKKQHTGDYINTCNQINFTMPVKLILCTQLYLCVGK